MDLGDREWGRKMNQDLVDIADWAVQNLAGEGVLRVDPRDEFVSDDRSD